MYVRESFKKVEERIMMARVITLEVELKCADDLLEEMQME